MHPSDMVAGTQQDPQPIADEIGHFLEGQSYAEAPSGHLLAAIITPEAGGAVSGAVTIDVRIVDKREVPCWQRCGVPRVTAVRIDGQTVAASVPFTWITFEAKDGSHTIAIDAADNCSAEPPCPNNTATDTVTVFVDNMRPTIATDLADADPERPGIQLERGTLVVWTMDDPPVEGYQSGIVGRSSISYHFDQPGCTTFTIPAEDYAGNRTTYEATVTVPGDHHPFRRGDANGDGGIDIGDAIYSLSYLFTHTPLGCLKAGDSNDSGGVDIADPIYTLTFLFARGPQPPRPFGECDFDPTDDELSCISFPNCDPW